MGEKKLCGGMSPLFQELVFFSPFFLFSTHNYSLLFLLRIHCTDTGPARLLSHLTPRMNRVCLRTSAGR